MIGWKPKNPRCTQCKAIMKHTQLYNLCFSRNCREFGFPLVLPQYIFKIFNLRTARTPIPLAHDISHWIWWNLPLTKLKNLINLTENPLKSHRTISQWFWQVKSPIPPVVSRIYGCTLHLEGSMPWGLKWKSPMALLTASQRGETSAKPFANSWDSHHESNASTKIIPARGPKQCGGVRR